MYPPLLQEQADLLRALAKAYSVPHPERGRETLIWSESSAGTRINHHAFDDRRVNIGDLEELDAQGLIAMGHGGDYSGDLRVTAAGYRAVEELDRRDRAVSGTPTGAVLAMDWDSEVSEVLAAVYTAWSEAGAPEDGVSQADINAQLGRDPDDDRTGRILRKLEQERYVQETIGIEESTGPAFCEPIGRTLEIFGGWPATTGEAAFAKLLSELDIRIEDAEGSEKGALVKVRDGLGDIGKSTAAGILAKVLSGGLGH